MEQVRSVRDVQDKCIASSSRKVYISALCTFFSFLSMEMKKQEERSEPITNFFTELFLNFIRARGWDIGNVIAPTLFEEYLTTNRDHEPVDFQIIDNPDREENMFLRFINKRQSERHETMSCYGRYRSAFIYLHTLYRKTINEELRESIAIFYSGLEHLIAEGSNKHKLFLGYQMAAGLFQHHSCPC